MNRLLQEFRCLYQARLDAIDERRETGLAEDILQKMKCDVLQTYVADLSEQNLLLVQTAEELEHETLLRVGVIEKLLQKTTVTSKEYMVKLRDYHQQLQKVSIEKKEHQSLIESLQSRYNVLEEEKNILQDQNVALTQGIDSLLHCVNQARITGSWEFGTAKPNDGTYDQLFGVPELTERHLSFDLKQDGLDFPFASPSHYRRQGTSSPCYPSECSISDVDASFLSSVPVNKDVLIKRLQVDLKFLQRSRDDAHSQLLQRDRTIADLQCEITELRHEQSVKDHECITHTQRLHLMQEQQHLTSIERSRHEEIIRHLKLLNSQSPHSAFVKTIDTQLMVAACTQTNNNFLNNRASMVQEKSIDAMKATIETLRKELFKKDRVIDDLELQLGFIKSSTVVLGKATESESTMLKNIVNSDKADLVVPVTSYKCDIQHDGTSDLHNSASLENNFGEIGKQTTCSSEIDVIISPAMARRECACREVELVPQSISKDAIDIAQIVGVIPPLEAAKGNDCLQLTGMHPEMANQFADSENYNEINECNEFLQQQLTETLADRDRYKSETEKLIADLQIVEATTQETRIVLTREIAERHDLIRALRNELCDQSDQHKEALQQLALKSEVVRDLRKEIKVAQAQIEEKQEEVNDCHQKLHTLQQQNIIQVTEIENQKITIRNLQEALVQSKRGFDTSPLIPPALVSNGLQSVSAVRAPSRPALSEVFDV